VAGPQAVVMLLMATIGLAVGIRLLKGDPVPPNSNLTLLYPYGQGGRLPNGRTAPGVFDVDFTLKNQLECHGTTCYLYEVVAKNGGFRMQMQFYQHNGAWVLDSTASQVQ